jgi:hypothetical protein
MSVPVMDNRPPVVAIRKVGQNRQCLPPFHHADDLADEGEGGFSLDAEFHGHVPFSDY